jgi:hypothetical protein
MAPASAFPENPDTRKGLLKFILLSFFTFSFVYFHWNLSLGESLNRTGRLHRRFPCWIMVLAVAFYFWSTILSEALSSPEGDIIPYVCNILLVLSIAWQTTAFVILGRKIREYLSVIGLQVKVNPLLAVLFQGFYAYYLVRKANILTTGQGHGTHFSAMQSPQPGSPAGFGQPPQAGSSAGFGQPPQAGSQSPFGQPAQAGSPAGFGQPPQAGSQSPFDLPAQAGSQSPFDLPAHPGSPAPFGQPPQAGSQSPFGQTAQAGSQSPFGQPAQPGSPAAFGQPPQPGSPAPFGQPPVQGPQQQTEQSAPSSVHRQNSSGNDVS